MSTALFAWASSQRQRRETALMNNVKAVRLPAAGAVPPFPPLEQREVGTRRTALPCHLGAPS